jgi:uncharacterized repeat protein (TIGR03803 family)
MRKHVLGKFASTIAAFCVASAIGSPAQTFTSLSSFDGNDGGYPVASLIQGADGNLYGTTEGDGISDGGTVIKITPEGQLATLYSFCSQPNCIDGGLPLAGLVRAASGSFYGTTAFGGTYGSGTVFEITPQGNLTTLYSFGAQGTDAQQPYGGLVQGTNGNFFGTSRVGGTYNQGTVFEVTPSGKLMVLYNFCPGGATCSDGQQPEAGLVLGTNGSFYGTTVGGGTHGSGAVFQITVTGKLTTLYSFCSQTNCTDGSSPYDGLVLGTDGNFYGTTEGGPLVGTVFRITARGKLTTLYSFCSQTNCSDGRFPFAGLVQGTDGDFYGTTAYGGVDLVCPFGLNIGCGTVFKITPSGKLTTLYAFCAGGSPCVDGMQPYAPLVQDTDGNFYGSTAVGGINRNCNGGQGCGTVFTVSTGLPSFVEANPNFGKVGRVVEILGNNLTGTSSVTFNGTSAAFKVISST